MMPAPPCEFCGRESSRTTYTGTDPEQPAPFTCILHSQAWTELDPYYHRDTIGHAVTETPLERDMRIDREERIRKWRERDERNAKTKTKTPRVGGTKVRTDDRRRPQGGNGVSPQVEALRRMTR